MEAAQRHFEALIDLLNSQSGKLTHDLDAIVTVTQRRIQEEHAASAHRQEQAGVRTAAEAADWKVRFAGTKTVARLALASFQRWVGLVAEGTRQREQEDAEAQIVLSQEVRMAGCTPHHLAPPCSYRAA